MKLKNKKTGEIVDFGSPAFIIDNTKNSVSMRIKNLAELNEEWENYEEPKEYWYIDWTPEIGAYYTRDTGSDFDERQKGIGNYFETQEEAEKAVEKLKAWKRLKDKGFRFTAWYGGSKNISYEITSLENETYIPRQICDDLDLLFGGES